MSSGYNFPRSVWIGQHSILYGKVTVGERTFIGNHVTVGYPKESRIQTYQERGEELGMDLSDPFDSVDSTHIGSGCRIGSNVVIYEGSNIGDGVCIDDGSRVGFDCLIGSDTRLSYAGFVCDRVIIGNRCVIAGFVCDASIIGDDSMVMGTLVHEFTQPHRPWGLYEAAPKVEEKVVIGFNAIIVGGVNIGHNSYVAAGAIVTKNVPPRSVVIGVNRFIASSDWSGRKLAPEFWRWGKEISE